MTASVALPEHVNESILGAIQTYIVPAPNGCDLQCPHCFIRLRREEAQSTDLSPADYVRFIEETAAREPIGAICIQGYEPLLPDSFIYTRKILETGKRLGVPTSLVTNGTHLAERAYDLARLEPHKIAVSLESSSAEDHDRSRGRVGAFDASVAGIQRARSFPQLRDGLTVASILFPKKPERLLSMPSLLESLGVSRWVITALQKVGKDELGGPVGDRSVIFQNLLILKRDADKHGIDFVVDDEFGILNEDAAQQDVVDINELRIRRLVRPSGVFRLLPTGQCSMGAEILQQVKPDTPRWVPGEMHAGDFIAGLRERSHIKPKCVVGGRDHGSKFACP